MLLKIVMMLWLIKLGLWFIKEEAHQNGVMVHHSHSVEKTSDAYQASMVPVSGD
jgi:hypothetical protein